MRWNAKITIVGAGHVGSHCAMTLGWRGLCREIVLTDVIPGKAVAHAADIADALAFPARNALVRDGSLEDCADADIVVIAIGGAPFRPGQTRLDLLEESAALAEDLATRLRRVKPQGIVITITNPADTVADQMRRALGLGRERVFGTGTLLDTARLLRILSEQSGVSQGSIEACCLGEHGDSAMIPFSQVRIGKESFELTGLDGPEILRRTRRAGMDIIQGKGATEFGIAAALADLCGCILTDEKRVLPLSVLLEGEYGQQGIHAGVPCRVGSGGIEGIVVLPLTPEEQAQFNYSCGVIRKYTERARNMSALHQI